jgi:protocatechuate 3,4-dioxygenase, beta subunit
MTQGVVHRRQRGDVMGDERGVSRRELIRACSAGALAWAAGVDLAAAQAEIRRTPAQILGPFYPVVKPADQDADLTRIAGRTARAAGQVIELAGRIINRHGRPVAGARIEIWQANVHGRYTHPSDRNTAPLDPNFEGYALLTTDAEGRYRFTTIKPGAYPEDSGVMRAPHIHFDVLGRTNRLVTQMYFEGEPLNETDRFLATAARNRERLIVPFSRRSGDDGVASLHGNWEIVLDEG